MRIVVISGIWPPDVGGPASHAPEAVEELAGRGHEVEAVTMADREPALEAYGVHWASRRLPMGARHLRAAALIRSRARHADVVYSTGLVGRSALGTTLARTPLVLKLTSDPTYERSVRFGLTRRDLASYQRQGGIRVRSLRLARDLALRRAAHIVCPSASLRELAIGWGLAPDRVTVLPNPVSAPRGLAEQAELRRRHRLNGPTLVYAGRLSVQKALDVALEALAKTPDVSLVIAGDGPDAELLRRRAEELSLDGRARFLGPQPRGAVFELLRAADAAVLSSKWENFPHMVVEALAVGTPVIATETGGVVEIVEDGQNGLLVPPGDPDALASSIERFFADEGLRERLRRAAAGSVAEYAPVHIYDRLEQILVEAAE
jgi:glycosyltransferase involved in cell wall biosynthesis